MKELMCIIFTLLSFQPSSPYIKYKSSVKFNIDKNVFLKEDLTYLSSDTIILVIQPPICASCYK